MTAVSLIGSTNGSALNGANVTLTYPTPNAGNIAIVSVTWGTAAATAMSVTSSSGAAFTQIVTTIQSSNIRFGVFRRVILSSAETQCIATGNASATASNTAVIHMFANVDRGTPEDVTATSTNGSGTTPDSPSITVASCGCGIISAVGISLVSAPTAPSSFLNATVASTSDTIPATTAQAWITNASTAAFNPTTWTSTTATWISATIALRRAFGDDQGGLDVIDSNDIVTTQERGVIVRSY